MHVQISALLLVDKNQQKTTAANYAILHTERLSERKQGANNVNLCFKEARMVLKGFTNIVFTLSM